MIERVVLHQSRFRTPGLVPDARGVALGPLGVVLLAGPDKLVSFLRASGEEGALDEMLDSLRIVQVLSPLRTREMLVEVQASSSHRMDRIAAIARLIGGMVFTGSGRHFVKYRDAQAPFGYDVAELLSDPADFCLYHDRFSQPYRTDRAIQVRDLILRLAPIHTPRLRSDIPRSLYALAQMGLGESLIGYFARWAVPARVALVEWARGGTSATIDRSYLFQLTSPAGRFVQLMRSLPGLRLFVPDGDRMVVELGFRHPIPLTACTPLFQAEEMVLFRAGGDGAITLPQRPPFVDVQTIISLGNVTQGATQEAKGTEIRSSFSLPLTLVGTSAPPRRVSAVVIDSMSQDALGRILSVMPPASLSKLTAAFTEGAIFVYGPESVYGIPLGEMYEEIGDGVFTPIGKTLSPPIPPDVVRSLTRTDRTVRLFITGGKFPITAVPESAFISATRLLVSDIPVMEETTLTPPLDGDRPLPDLWPDPPGLFAAVGSAGSKTDLPPDRGLSAGTIIARGDGNDGD